MDDATWNALALIRDDARRRAIDSDRLALGLTEILNAADISPDVSEEPGVTPRPTGLVLATGPFTVDGADYSGGQIGSLFKNSSGQSFPNGFPSYTRPQPSDGFCSMTGKNFDRLELELSRADSPSYSATTLWEQHLPFPPASEVGLTYSFERVTDENMRTIKAGGGIVGFNHHDWKDWPGGGRHHPENFSVRTVVNADDGNGPRWELYLYLGAKISPDQVGYEGSKEPRISTLNDGHTLEVVAVNGPMVRSGVEYEIRLEATAGTPGKNDGSVRFLVRELGIPAWGPWELVMDLTGIQWAASGAGLWTRGYPMVMYGGRNESFAPQNSTQTGVVRVGRYEYAALD